MSFSILKQYKSAFVVAYDALFHYLYYCVHLFITLLFVRP